jgi:hypothetical protein
MDYHVGKKNMDLTLLLIWVIIWVIFLAMSTFETRGMVYGFMAGIWILLLGCYILVDGLYMDIGSTIVSEGSNYIVTVTKEQVVPPFSSYGVLWCFPFIAVSIYQMYLAITMKRDKSSIRIG